MSLMQVVPGHVSTWAHFFFWRRVLWTAIIVGPILSIVASITLTGSDRVLLPLTVWAFVVVLVAYRLQRFHCPRCQRHFFPRRPLLLGLTARRCVSCMLPKE